MQLANGLNLFSSFHTYDYARHFVSACTRILGFEGTPEGVEDQGRLTRVAAVCYSYIDPSDYHDTRIVRGKLFVSMSVLLCICLPFKFVDSYCYFCLFVSMYSVSHWDRF